MEDFGVVDLCCGMGGLSYAAKQAGLPVWAGVDISKHALNSYKMNLPKAATISTDITKLKAVVQELDKIIYQHKQHKLIIVSGPPCQGFSDAGPRRVDDPRNVLLLAVAKAILKLKPYGAIVENVSALNKPRNISLLKKFYNSLHVGGYFIYSLELNSLDFGVSQKRTRIIYFILPQPNSKAEILEKIKKFRRPPKNVSECIGNLPIPLLRPLNYDPKDDKSYITNHFAMRHSERVRNKIASINVGGGPLSYRKLDPTSYAPTLLSGHRAPPVHYEQNRSITVREALRLQGFPDSFRVMGTFASQMGQVTNAVPFPLGFAVINVLLSILSEKKNEIAKKQLL